LIVFMKLTELENASEFHARHIGPGPDDLTAMLKVVGSNSLDELMRKIIPAGIHKKDLLNLPEPLSEAQALAEMKRIAGKNKVLKSFIGQGYYGTHTPGVILRNILENPAWYTAYTPYQPEISQGRLEALLNFQTMICELTGMAISNSSLLDEATAAAEAMTLAKRSAKGGAGNRAGQDPRRAAGPEGHGRLCTQAHGRAGLLCRAGAVPQHGGSDP
jgi:glycine dehydrogenase